MKSLEQLTSVDKSPLLHKLFSDEVPALLQYAKEKCTLIDRDKDTI